MKLLFTLMLTACIACSSFGQVAGVSRVSGLAHVPSHKFPVPLTAPNLRTLKDQNRPGSDKKPRYLQEKLLSLMQEMDNYLYQEYDSVNNLWVNNSLDEFSYDDTGKNTGDIYSTWDNSTSGFVPDSRLDISYNSEDAITLELFSTWNAETSKWVNSGKMEFAFLASGTERVETDFTWDETRSLWIPLQQYDRTFRPDGKIQSETGTNWNASDNVWINFMKWDYVYNSGGYLILNINSTWNSVNNGWENSDKTEYSLNPDGSVAIETVFSWDKVLGIWVTVNRITSTYDANGSLILEIGSQWDAGTLQFVNAWKDVYTPDEHMNEVIDESYKWIVNAWFINEKTEFTYNNTYTYDQLVLPSVYRQEEANNLFRHMLTQIIDYTGNPLVPASKNIFTYSEVDVNSVSELNSNSAFVFPQPAHDEITFSWEIAKQFLDLRLYDINGRLVADQRIANNSVFSVANLEPGFYIYMLTGNAGMMYAGKLSIK